MKLLPSIVIGVVAVSVVASFFIIGSPIKERVRRFDERRISDLQSIQWEVVNYWQKKSQLPATLVALNDDIRGFSVPRDPETGGAYEYAGEGATSFSLCATFSLANNDRSDARGMTKPVPVGGENQSWAHGAHRTCFTRTIDKDLYPPALQATRGRPVPIKPMSVVQ